MLYLISPSRDTQLHPPSVTALRTFSKEVQLQTTSCSRLEEASFRCKIWLLAMQTQPRRNNTLLFGSSEDGKVVFKHYIPEIMDTKS